MNCLSKIARLFIVLLTAFLTVGCVHTGIVSNVTATNVYSDSDKKVEGDFSYVVDTTSLTKLKLDDSVHGYICSAHKFPIDASDAFVNSIPSMVDQVFEKITKLNTAESNPNKVQLLFRVERFTAKVRFIPKFFTNDAEATVELTVGVTGTKNGKRVFGTVADSQRTKSADGGGMCEGGGQAAADAASDAIKDVLEKLGERMANSRSLRELAK